MTPSGAGIVQVPDSVFISWVALETIEHNAYAEAPRECCGLLLGRFAPPDSPPAPPGSLRLVKGANASDATEAEDAARAIEEELGLGGGGGDVEGGGGFSIPLPDVLTVEDAVPTRNASIEPTRYLVEPEDHFRILRDARRRGLDIVGAYHSHAITPPVPSETDLAEAHPHFLYVIGSPDWDTGEGCDFRAWWLVDGNFQEVTIVPVR
jgi:proteasome lid subunit RPN8/RPN11